MKLKIHVSISFITSGSGTTVMKQKQPHHIFVMDFCNFFDFSHPKPAASHAMQQQFLEQCLSSRSGPSATLLGAFVTPKIHSDSPSNFKGGKLFPKQWWSGLQSFYRCNDSATYSIIRVNCSTTFQLWHSHRWHSCIYGWLLLQIFMLIVSLKAEILIQTINLGPNVLNLHQKDVVVLFSRSQLLITALSNQNAIPPFSGVSNMKDKNHEAPNCPRHYNHARNSLPWFSGLDNSRLLWNYCLVARFQR